MTPESFNGHFVIYPPPDRLPFDIWFYRRDDENHTLEDFIDSIKPQDIAYDKPTNTLYYKDIAGKLYKLNFEAVEES